MRDLGHGALFGVLLLGVVGCDGASGDCTPPPAGTYTASGSCFGMTMTATLSTDGGDCGFTLSGWSMDHGDLPDGGTLEGEAVTLTGEGLSGCEGILEDERLSGICDDGCAWELVYAE